MNPRLWKHAERAATLSFLAYVVSQVLIVRVLGRTGDDLVKLQFTYDLASFKAVFAGWTGEDVARFLAHFPYDFVHPFVYGASLSFGIAFALQKAKLTRWDRWIFLPYVASACDVLENVFYLKFFEAWRVDPNDAALPRLFHLANGFCSTKWVLVTSGLTLLIGAWLWTAAGKLGLRRPS